MRTWIGLLQHDNLGHIFLGEAEQNVAELPAQLHFLEDGFARIVYFYTRSLHSHSHR